MNSFQQDGQMNEEQKAFTAYLIKILKPKDQRDFESKIAQLSEDDLKEYYKQFKTMEGNQISFAKIGAKLNYIQSLRGTCPEGYEVEKFMAGGCVKCRKKAAEGTKVVDIFKEKCGGKAKKRVTKKKNMGGTVDTSWTVPKDQKGSKVEVNGHRAKITSKDGESSYNTKTNSQRFVSGKDTTWVENGKSYSNSFDKYYKNGKRPKDKEALVKRVNANVDGPKKHSFGNSIQRRITKD